MNVLKIAEKCGATQGRFNYPDGELLVGFTEKGLELFSSEMDAQNKARNEVDQDAIDSYILLEKELKKERDDLIAEAVKTLAITHAEQDEYENDLAAIKKERDELRADNLSLVNRLEQECARLGMVTAELKAWTDLK